MSRLHVREASNPTQVAIVHREPALALDDIAFQSFVSGQRFVQRQVHLRQVRDIVPDGHAMVVHAADVQHVRGHIHRRANHAQRLCIRRMYQEHAFVVERCQVALPSGGRAVSGHAAVLALHFVAGCPLVVAKRFRKVGHRFVAYVERSPSPSVVQCNVQLNHIKVRELNRVNRRADNLVSRESNRIFRRRDIDGSGRSIPHLEVQVVMRSAVAVNRQQCIIRVVHTDVLIRSDTHAFIVLERS